MKILFLNPHVDAAHRALQSLQKKGAALLLPANPTEAWQMLQLHGASVDLAIIHREGKDGQGESGLGFVNRVKRDAAHSDLPLIVTSSRWSDAEFADHQRSPAGANAYLRHPFDEAQLESMIEAVLGSSISALAQSSVPPKPKSGSRASVSSSRGAGKSPQAPGTQSGLILEDASAIFERPERSGRSDTSIRLEAPVLDAPEATTGTVAIAAPSEAIEPAFSSMEASAEPPAPPILPAVLPDNVGLPLVPIATAPTVTDPAEFEALLDAPAASAPEPGPEIEVPSVDTAASRDLGVSPLSTSLPLTPAGHIPEGMLDAEGDDPAMSEEMPYLFGSPKGGAPSRAEIAAAFMAMAQPVGDAVVPGGAAHAPDLETLKKYLLLREQDVAALSTQLKGAREQVSAVEDALRAEKARSVDLGHTVEEQGRKIGEFEREKTLALEGLQAEINELRFQIKAKTDKARLLESQVREATGEMERLKERVRLDIRKIRVREKELENRLEIMKKDSEALIAARENKIIELKRRLDLIEFNMDLLQDQYSREKETSARLRERLARAAQVVRVAGGLLDNNGNPASAPAAAPGDEGVESEDTRAAS